jgi:type II secretory pathway pseudopilin PulG
MTEHSRTRLASVMKGSTLLELLVATAILMGLLVLLLGAVEGSTRFWHGMEKRRAPLREAGAALRMMDDDLMSAVITADPASLLIRSNASGDSLFFLVSHHPDQRDEECHGDLCATGYFMAPSPDHPEERDLFRFHAGGEAVSDALQHGRLQALYDSASPGSSNTELLARDVADLKILPLPSGGASRGALQTTIVTVDDHTGRKLESAAIPPAERASILQREGARLTGIVVIPQPGKELPVP